MRLPTATLLAIALAGSAWSQATPVKEGFVQVEGGKVWYRLVGSGPKLPLVVLHGGPAIAHNYLNSLAALAKDRPVLFYDQLGCGKSDRPNDESLWTVKHFVDELATVKKAMGIHQFILYGHSWGSMLAASYMGATRDPDVRALILAGPALNVKYWERDARKFVSQLSKRDRQAVAQAERTNKFDTPSYQEAVKHYYRVHMLRKDKWPEDANASMAAIGLPVYTKMCGPSEFTILGNLRSFDATVTLKHIHTPTLFLCGQFDEATPRSTRAYARLVKGSKMVVLPGCSHLANCEKPELYNAVIQRFLHKAKL